VNLGELRAATRTLMGDLAQPYLWEDADIDRRLNNAVREACLRARLLKDDADSLPALCSLPITAGQAIVAYNAAILVVRSGVLVGSCRKLWALSAESMDRQEPNWDTNTCTGTPEYMVMDLTQKTLRLYPTPDTSTTLRLRVWRMPLATDLMESDTDEPVIQIPDVEELCHWAASECYMVNDAELRSEAKSGEQLALFEQRFGSRPSLHDMARWADSPSRVRHAHMF
jgi:hypothetical protein